MNNNRRTFFMTLAAGTSLLATSARAQAKLDEKNPQAVALGYVADATKTDTKNSSAGKTQQTMSRLPTREFVLIFSKWVKESHRI